MIYRNIGKCEFLGVWTPYVLEYALGARSHQQNTCNMSYTCRVYLSGGIWSVIGGCSVG